MSVIEFRKDVFIFVSLIFLSTKGFGFAPPETIENLSTKPSEKSSTTLPTSDSVTKKTDIKLTVDLSAKSLQPTASTKPTTLSKQRSPSFVEYNSLSTTVGTEVKDLLSSKVYRGGNEVDEIGIGNFKDFKSKEEEKMHVTEGVKEIRAISETAGLTVIPGNGESKSINTGRTLAAGLSVSICFVVAISGYLGVLLWRKKLVKRYGNREELINDDDLVDANDSDMHHFEGTTIQFAD